MALYNKNEIIDMISSGISTIESISNRGTIFEKSKDRTLVNKLKALLVGLKTDNSISDDTAINIYNIFNSSILQHYNMITPGRPNLNTAYNSTIEDGIHRIMKLLDTSKTKSNNTDNAQIIDTPQITETISPEIDQLSDKLNMLNESFETMSREHELKFANMNKNILDKINENALHAGEAISIAKQASDKISEYEEGIIKASKSFSNTFDTIKNDLEDKQNKLEKLFGTVTSDTICGNYSQAYSSENTSSKIWRVVSVILLFATIIWVFNIYSNTQEVINDNSSTTTTESATNFVTSTNKTDIDWYTIFSQVSLTFLLLYSSVYAGQLANKHRNESLKIRSLELQITALEPFIAQLEEDDKIYMRKSVGERIFIGADTNNSNINDEKHIAQFIMNIISELASNVSKKS